MIKAGAFEGLLVVARVTVRLLTGTSRSGTF